MEAEIIKWFLGLVGSLGAGLFFFVLRSLSRQVKELKEAATQQTEALKVELRRDFEKLQHIAEQTLEKINNHEVRLTVLEKLQERGTHGEQR